MNGFAKALFLATALAPIFAVFGLNRILTHGRDFTFVDTLPIMGSTVLTVVCWSLLRFCLKRIESEPITIKSVKNTDRDLVPFLIAYVLPLAIANTTSVAGHAAAILFVLAFALLLAFRSHLAVANPVVAIIGYRFYEVQSENGMTFVLLSKRPILSTGRPLIAHHLSDVVFVASEEEG
jgi:hypothetical protein